MKIEIVCGLPGVGKSTYTNNKYVEVINVDSLFYKNGKCDILNFKSKLLEELKANDFEMGGIENRICIDSWFMWGPEWWKKDDPCLELLEKVRSRYTVNFTLLTDESLLVLDRYYKRHIKARTTHDIMIDYAETIEDRYQELVKRVTKVDPNYNYIHVSKELMKGSYN